MPVVLIHAKLGYHNITPVYKNALGDGANGLSVEEPDRRPDSAYEFVVAENFSSDEDEEDTRDYSGTIRVYHEEDGDIAVYDPLGRDNEVYQRTDGGSYDEAIRQIIKRSEHMEIE